MTISNQSNKSVYLGNGVTTVFNYTFQIFNESHLVVKKFDGTSEVTLNLTTDYTVTGVNDINGGTVVLTTAPDIDNTLFLIRVVPLTQETDIRNQGPFHAEIHEDEYDRQIMIDQQLTESASRALSVPLAAANSGFNTTLPQDISFTPGSGQEKVIGTDGEKTVLGPSFATIEGAVASAAQAANSATEAAGSATNASISELTAAASTAAGLVALAATQAASAQASNVISSIIYSDVKFTSSNVVVSVSDSGCIFVVDTTGGPITATLPEIATLDNSVANFNVGFRKSDDSSNSLTILSSATDAIDQTSDPVIITTQGGGATLIADEDTAPDTWTTIRTGSESGNSSVSILDGDGTQTAFTLNNPISSENTLDVYISGVHQSPDTYTINMSDVVFDLAPAVGVGNIIVKQQSTISIGAPSDGTVRVSSFDSSAITEVSSPSKVVKTTAAGTIGQTLLPDVALPHFQAVRSIAGDVPSGTQDLAVTYDQVDYNDFNYNSTTGAITLSQGGLYSMAGLVTLAAVPGVFNTLLFVLNVSGLDDYHGQAPVTPSSLIGGIIASNVAATLRLPANTVITPRITHFNGGSSQNAAFLNSGGTRTYLTITRLSA